jgi:hypothetical protein
LVRTKWRSLTDDDYAEIARYARPPAASGIELSPEQASNLEQYARSSGLADEYRNYDITSGNFIDVRGAWKVRGLRPPAGEGDGTAPMSDAVTFPTG